MSVEDPGFEVMEGQHELRQTRQQGCLSLNIHQ